MEIRKEFLPYGMPYCGEEEINEVVDALRSGWWSKGPKTMELEKRFADFVGAKHAIAVNSCTAALHTAIMSKGIGEGDEVITTPMTFCSTVNTIVHSGATPVFSDVGEDSLLNPDKIEEKITARTKAIVPVHYAGMPCNMDKFKAIAKKHNLFLLEDAAHAVYATYKDQMVGSIGDATAFSFYATKNLATGEGGMLTTNDDELADKARIMSLHGMSKNAWNRYGKGGSWRYDVLVPGYKYNMTDIQAALGLCQLNRLPQMQATRAKYVAIYNEMLADLQGVATPPPAVDGRHAWHLYAIRIKQDQLDIGRDEFVEELSDYNVGTSVHFIPVHLHPFYQERFGTKEGDFPVAEKIFHEVLSLPLYPSMTEDDVRYVANCVREIATKHAI